ncbi:MAG: NAD-dependent epimerase/dehydratase family protein [Pyrinomonadaceae bacterium]
MNRGNIKVLLTGATGYVGSVVAEKLLAKGQQVLVTDE